MQMPIQGFHVFCLYFKLEWQSSKWKAEQGQELFCTCTCASVKSGSNVVTNGYMKNALNHNYHFFVVGQGRDCTYVYKKFSYFILISVMFQDIM